MGKIRGANSSPGIYTQITDLHYAADSLGITTLGLVGETLKGPAFEPIAISNWAKFQDYFGGTSTELFSGSKYPKYELPYIAKSYLTASDQLYVCRVLGLSGYNAGPAFMLVQNSKVIGVLRSKTINTSASVSSTSICDTNGDEPEFKVSTISVKTHEFSDEFKDICGNEVSVEGDTDPRIIDITYADGDVNKTVVVSLIPGRKDYIYNVLGSSAVSGSYALYVESIYDAMISDEGEIDVTMIGAEVEKEDAEGKKITYISKTADYKSMFQHAQTPWFVSEYNNGDVKKLFRLHTISDGVAANSQVKVTISNIKLDEGTFDLIVRDFADTDQMQIVLESYKNVCLVPGTSNYLGLRMGTLNGDYPIKSKYLIAEINESEEVESSVPCGFMGYPVHQIDGEYDIETPTMNYNCSYDNSKRANKQCFGLSNVGKGIDVDMLFYKGVSAYAPDAHTTSGFHLDQRATNCTVDGEEYEGGFSVIDDRTFYIPVMSSEDEIKTLESDFMDIKKRKFTCCPYGGFDGWDINKDRRTIDNDYRSNKYNGTFYSPDSIGDSVEGLALPAGFNSSDYYAYLAGAMQFSNPDRFTINLFATPGIDAINNQMLVSDVLEMVHDRMDTLYIVTTPDKPKGVDDSVDSMYTPDNVVDEIDSTGIDSYYASTYYPWVRYYDSVNAKYISLPVTKDVVRNMANIDNKKYPWYAPAGIERGNVECNRARIFTKLNDENVIYDGRINPVKTFSADGVKIWGNKTLYTGDTPMNRINTVRLVLYMRKLISESIKTLIFEPNDVTLKQQFEGIVAPILDQIKSDRGITDYRLKVSQTAEQMDAHEISAQLHIKPTPTLEYIELDFVVTPQGVDWNE